MPTIPQFFYNPSDNMVMDLVESNDGTYAKIVSFYTEYDFENNEYIISPGMEDQKIENDVEISPYQYTLVIKEISYEQLQQYRAGNLFYNLDTDTLYSN